VGNFENRFVIGPTNVVAGGRYKLEPGGPTQFDRLTYEKDIEFRDERELPFQIVRGWVYRGTDKTENGWLIVFSKEPSAKTGTFPVYYVLRPGEDFRRWILPNGTGRYDGGLQDEISAVLWANQLDFNRLGGNPPPNTFVISVSFVVNPARHPPFRDLPCHSVAICAMTCSPLS
jgi:hypothetical protein